MEPGERLIVTPGAILGLFFMQRYRFLTITQFAAVTGLSYKHTADLLRGFESRGHIGYFGHVRIPGHGKTPKAYFIKRKGWELLRRTGDIPEELIGSFIEAHREETWSPQMYHRLRLLDLLIALEVQVRGRPQLNLVKTFLEYRRVKRQGRIARETTDYVAAEEIPENRIIPDGAFILENIETGRRGLYFLEMDMATERIVTQISHDRRMTLRFKFEQYDRYLQSRRFAETYAEYGEFRNFILLFVTFGQERVSNIRGALADLPAELHPFYRFATFEDAQGDFLGAIWLSRSPEDTGKYMLAR
jgi:protein involved in plasmid replication-relaxation